MNYRNTANQMTHFEVLKLLANEYPDKESQICFILSMRKVSISVVRKAIFDTTGLYLKGEKNYFELEKGHEERAKIVMESWVRLSKNEK